MFLINFRNTHFYRKFYCSIQDKTPTKTKFPREILFLYPKKPQPELMDGRVALEVKQLN